MRYFVALLFLLAACAPITLDAPADAPAEVPAPEQQPVPEPAHEPVVEARTPNAEVVALWDRVDSLQGYSFTLARLPEKSGDLTYYVRGRKAMVEPVSPVNMGDWNADRILVDFDAESAMGYCVELASCIRMEKSGATSFSDYDIPLPDEWLERVQYGEIVGTQQFNNRRVQIVRWEEEGLFYEAYLDDFYGLPQRVAVASDSEMTDIIDGGEYQGMQTNNVKLEDVEPAY